MFDKIPEEKLSEAFCKIGNLHAQFLAGLLGVSKEYNIPLEDLSDFTLTAQMLFAKGINIPIFDTPLEVEKDIHEDGIDIHIRYNGCCDK